jgi:hypothetical protein
MPTDDGILVRRVLHILFAVVIIYYLLPQTIFGIPRYYYFVLVIFLLPLVAEIIRIRSKTIFYGLHEHEGDHVASYVWFTTGATILILFFPQQIAAPCIVVTALGDPVIGLTKPYRRRVLFAISFIIILFVFLIFQYDILVAIFAAAIAFIAESFEFKIRVRLRSNIFWSRSRHKFSKYRRFFDFLFRTDDDFMMQIIPAVALLILFTIIPELLPMEIIQPLQSLLPYA